MVAQKKVIFIFTRGYLPGKKYGGAVTSIESFIIEISDVYDIKIICEDHDFQETKRYENILDGWNQIGDASVYYCRKEENVISTYRRLIEPYKNSTVCFYVFGIFEVRSISFAKQLSKEYGIPILLVPCGAGIKSLIRSKSRLKRIKQEGFFLVSFLLNYYKNIYFQTTSDEETESLKYYLHIKDDKIFQLEHFPPRALKGKKQSKEKEKLSIVFVSRIEKKKNLSFALEVVKEISDKYEIIFDIYGPKEDPEYWNICSSLIDDINKNKKNIEVSYKGALSPIEAKTIYQNYDCFLFPTLSENYGYVIAESIASGCPVIISKGTTPFDDIDGNGGYVVPLSNKKLFVSRIEEIATTNNLEYNALISLLENYVQSKFHVEQLKASYDKIFLTIT